jgi:ubiquinone biosynthesis protein UbiJ
LAKAKKQLNKRPTKLDGHTRVFARHRALSKEFAPVPIGIFADEIATLTKAVEALKQRVRQLEKKSR